MGLKVLNQLENNHPIDEIKSRIKSYSDFYFVEDCIFVMDTFGIKTTIDISNDFKIYEKIRHYLEDILLYQFIGDSNKLGGFLKTEKRLKKINKLV